MVMAADAHSEYFTPNVFQRENGYANAPQILGFNVKFIACLGWVFFTPSKNIL